MSCQQILSSIAVAIAKFGTLHLINVLHLCPCWAVIVICRMSGTMQLWVCGFLTQILLRFKKNCLLQSYHVHLQRHGLSKKALSDFNVNVPNCRAQLRPLMKLQHRQRRSDPMGSLRAHKTGGGKSTSAPRYLSLEACVHWSIHGTHMLHASLAYTHLNKLCWVTLGS